MSAAMVRRAIAGLARAILPSVDHRHFHKIAECETIIDPHRRTAKTGQARTYRHVLIERLIGGSPAQQELGRILENLRPLIAIIVLDLMIVPGHERWHIGAEALQVGIELILTISIAIVRERLGGNAIGMLADRRAAPFNGIVDVVAQKQSKIGIVVGKMAIGGEIAVLIIRARDKSETEPFQRIPRRWGGDCP